MRTTIRFNVENPKTIKQQLLQWSSLFEEAVYLDSNNHKSKYTSYDAILAVDGFTSIKTDDFDAFTRLEEFVTTTKDWLFGYLSYDVKNSVERLSSKNHEELEFPKVYFFQPKKLWLLKDDVLEAHYLPMVDDEIEEDFERISSMTFSENLQHNDIKIKLRTTKDDYFDKVGKVLEHIHRGDIYEANLCQEFYAEAKIDPLQTFKNLNRISEPPFATYMRLFDNYMMSASPERYLKKDGHTIISQPIKGTARRSKVKAEDEQLKHKLATDPKERSENIMIVDLVRNDLSQTATKGSVKVEELCKIYTFEQVHQMISTVTSQVTENTSAIDILRTTFPMGSMTGAPKVSAMKIIENLEDAKRGLYSGALGYFTPEADFDFSVVIRSILYNERKQYISYSVGGAITAQSIIENEYEECLIKAKAMREALLNSTTN